jgi:hypothetical protein
MARDSNRQSHSSKPKRKFAVFEDSGITDAERREIRQSQRTLQQTLRNGEAGTMDELEEMRQRNNEIYQDRVRFTREAVLDADNVDLITGQMAKQIENQVQVRASLVFGCCLFVCLFIYLIIVTTRLTITAIFNPSTLLLLIKLRVFCKGPSFRRAQTDP